MIKISPQVPSDSPVSTLAFLAALSAFTWLGVFLAGVLEPTLWLLETDLVSSLSPTLSLVTLLARFILSALGVFTANRKTYRAGK